MGLLDRIRGGARAGAASAAEVLHEGYDDLEVVGESQYQDWLWRLCGARPGQRVRHPIIAVLVPEPDNPFDANAIAVRVRGGVVGYLSRGQAAQYLSGLHGLMRACGGLVALRGVIVGGGYYDDGPGRLGVWLQHDPAAFGVTPPSGPTYGDRSRAVAVDPLGSMRTGLTEAWASDLDDDTYDLSWYHGIPNGDELAVDYLERQLAQDPDPLDRHFQFSELETRLYRMRELRDDALARYDDACRRHDAEMETICAAFRRKWGKVPLLETYRQMAIRQQKIKNWTACLWWAERGLALYGQDAVRVDAVEDLLKRRNRALSKLEVEAG
ncbi:HIRAN domain-containing protein [Spongisporangium articulatum]|uniref:HIRAN domain-containing protein n=1 Tax=Spongisporangium articulatum TaxID=3362603 RepID=A0ABW8AMC8_9ACTN